MGGWVTEIQVSDVDDVTYLGRTSAKKKKKKKKKLSSTCPLTGLSFCSDTYFVSVADRISLNVYIPFADTLLSPPPPFQNPHHPQFTHNHMTTRQPSLLAIPTPLPCLALTSPSPSSSKTSSPLHCCVAAYIHHIPTTPCHLDFLKIAHSSRTQPRQRSPKIDNDVSKRCNRYPSSLTPIRDLLAHHFSHSGEHPRTQVLDSPDRKAR
ncbi:hypothetical protein QC764_117168 [Podospora pseudoanserina]|uniref:Uncharacterized protein n=1 Tax=Podospora pseudoanserina TaxID=2609844 RepID=A0ABR0IQY1_9PEZI|nr:hypothetical protein QC764_117168 [Podospora pseudoanserina]